MSSRVVRVSANVIYVRRCDVLFMRRCNTEYRDGWWGLPAGRVEPGETPAQAARREFREETGIDLPHSAFEPVQVMYRAVGVTDAPVTWVDYFYEVNDGTTDVPRIAEPDKCDGLGFYHGTDSPTPLIPHVAHAVFCWRNGIVFSDWQE